MFSPDAKFIASTNLKAIHIWNVKNRKSEAIFEGHSHIVRSICYSHDGNYICMIKLYKGSGSEDNTIRIWNINTR